MRLIDADKMIADLLTVDPQYETMIDWCIRVTEAQPSIDAVDRRALAETIKHYAQYPDGMSRLLEVYDAKMEGAGSEDIPMEYFESGGR